MRVSVIQQPGAYTVILPFQPIGGGQAIDVVPTGGGAVAAIPEWAKAAETVQLCNDSNVSWWLLFGTSSGMAPGLGLPCPPGCLVVYTMPGDGTYTHYCVKTRSGSATGTLNFGLGS